jgi:hypothetical protein
MDEFFETNGKIIVYNIPGRDDGMASSMKHSNNRVIPHGLVVVTALLVASGVTGCKQEEVDCYWPSRHVSVDGQVDDWSGIPGKYYPDEGLVFSVANDSANIYLLLSFRNPMWAMAIRHSGLTVWLDPKGKKNKAFGFRYRGGPSSGQLRQLRTADHMPTPWMTPPEESGRKQVADTEAFDELRLITSDNSEGVSVFADGSQGPAAGHGLPKGIFCYEFSIPLESLAAQGYSLLAQPGRMIGVGAHWGKLDRPRRPSRLEGMNEGPPGMGEGPPGMGGRRGGRGPGGGFRTESAKEQDIWVRTRLAVESGRSAGQR